MNILIYKIYQQPGTGEIFQEKIICHFQEINIFHNTVVHVGHMEQQVQLLIELIL